MSISGRPILGIETSCDETAAAVVADGHIYSNAIFSQTEHSLYGGVVPELASRNHIRTLLPVVDQALSEADLELGDLDGIAVTQGPGLVGCLLVGISVGKGLALGSGLPLVGVHHIEGHLFSGSMAHPDLVPPFMALVASGGHTELIYVCAWGNYERWGRTRDDAAGEAFDKVAKILGLLREGEVTMGGPRISMLAEEGNPDAFDFPRALINDPGFDFSFSGLKTSVLYRIRDLAVEDLEAIRANIAASFQAAVVDVLVDKTIRAAREVGAERILLSGGVAANRALRAQLDNGASKLGMGVFYPPTPLCTDNAAMIAGAGAFRLSRGEVAGGNLNAAPRLPLPRVARAAGIKMPRDIGFSASDGWLLLLVGCAGIYLAFLMYRSRLTGIHRLLLGLRIAALILLIGLLMEPILALTLHTQRLPLVAVLIDDSESMKIADGDTARCEVAKAVLADPTLKNLRDRARVTQFRFSDILTPLRGGEEPTWTGRATDLAGALDGVRERTMGEGLAAVVLISDGGQNLGGRPSELAVDLGAPVLAVGTGNPVVPKDVSIVSAVIDPLGYVGRSLVMQVRVLSSGFERVSEQVRVLLDDREVSAQTIALADGEQALEFEIRPERSGRHVFSVQIAAQAGERTVGNNRVVVSTDVLESRVRILILAGSPSADLGYLRRVLQEDANLEVELLVRTLTAGWQRDVNRALRSLDERDIVALINVPYEALAGMTEQALVAFVQKGGGLLGLGGDAAFDDGYARSALTDVLPLQFLGSSDTFQERAFALSFPDSRHPILRVSDDPLGDRDAWEALPPLLSYNRVGAAISNATVLVHHPTERVAGKPMPVLAIRRVGAGKTAIVVYQTFWRHGLMMWGDGKTDVVARAFWKNMVRWLVTRNEVSRLKIMTEKPAYRSGEAVAVHASVFDHLLQPRSGARVLARVGDSLGVREVVLRDLGGGRYAGNLGRFPQGDYELQVQARANDGDLGTGTGRFTVGRYSLEYETVRMRAELLSDIATRSGGQYVRPGDLKAALDSLVLAPEPVVTHYRVRLWGHEWPIFVLVGLLVLEWTIRRRLGMV